MKISNINIAILGAVLLVFFSFTIINKNSEVTYYTSENYNIASIMMSHHIEKIYSIPRSDAAVETDGDFYIEYHKNIFGDEWLEQYNLLDDEETADAADLKSQLEEFKK